MLPWCDHGTGSNSRNRAASVQFQSFQIPYGIDSVSFLIPCDKFGLNFHFVKYGLILTSACTNRLGFDLALWPSVLFALRFLKLQYCEHCIDFNFYFRSVQFRL